MKYLLSLFLIVSLNIPKNAHALFWTLLARLTARTVIIEESDESDENEENRKPQNQEDKEIERDLKMLGIGGAVGGAVVGGIVLAKYVAKKKGISVKDALKPISLCRRIFKKNNDTNNQAIKE